MRSHGLRGRPSLRKPQRKARRLTPAKISNSHNHSPGAAPIKNRGLGGLRALAFQPPPVMDHGLARRAVPEFANSNHSTAQAIARTWSCSDRVQRRPGAGRALGDLQSPPPRCARRTQRSTIALIAALQPARSNNLCAAARLTTPETSARRRDRSSSSCT